ncbi:FtsX-like permease family protein [Sphingomonas sp. 1P06PA]|uniref:cell division protein FtsX n=1 Tax=Sphingomonas sp. 1P06PA TaxID=554121 RepID=UPI0039A4E952
MKFAFGPAAADRRLLPEGRIAGPMPLVIAIMMFLTALAAAGGLGLGHAARGLGSDLAERLTVQIVAADPAVRQRQTNAIVSRLARDPAVRRADRVPDAELEAMVAPWLGAEGLGRELPLPAMIDVDLADPAQRQRISALIRDAAPAARIDDHATTLAPLAGLIAALKWLAVGLVVLMAAATGFTVVLAARAALNTHRATIDVMHLLGATDLQIARLFQRRIALDALFGSLLGLGLAVLVIVALGAQVARLGSELIGSIALPPAAWVALAALPLAGTLLAMLAARWTVVTALRQIL